MSKLPPARYQIWNYGKPGLARLDGLDTARRERGRFSGLETADLYADLGASARSLAETDKSAVSLYHYGLPMEVELPGLCILPNGRSGACKTKKISSDQVELIYDGGSSSYRFKLPPDLLAGAQMRLDLERIGEFHGALKAHTHDGFQLAVDAECKHRLSNRLAILATTIRNAGLDDTTATKPSVIRLEPDTKNCRFTDHVGVARKGTIINVSPVDALIKTPVVPPVGAHIVFSGPGRYTAEVTRVFEIGFAVNFSPPIPAPQFSAAIRLID
jgi:hypothetical protein